MQTQQLKTSLLKIVLMINIKSYEAAHYLLSTGADGGI